MWSPYWPQWFLSALALFLSPLKSLVLPRVPEPYRTAAVYAVALFATLWVVILTPMTWKELVPQASLLWGMILGGYVAAKSNALWAPAVLYTGANAALTSATAVGLILVPAAFGQDTTTAAGVALADSAKEIALAQAGQWILWFFSILGGKLGRKTDDIMAKRAARRKVAPIEP